MKPFHLPLVQALCPRCHRNPARRSRRPGKGKTPLCEGCWDIARRAHYRAIHESRLLARVGSPTFKRIERDDIPAAEIERRFTEALAQIRKRGSELIRE